MMHRADIHPTLPTSHFAIRKFPWFFSMAPVSLDISSREMNFALMTSTTSDVNDPIMTTSNL